MNNKLLAETTKTVFDMFKNGKSKSKIAEELDIGLHYIEHILETDSVGNYININKVFLYDISSEIDDEIRNINGVANLLFCLSDSISELNDDAMRVLGSHLYDVRERLMTLSSVVMEFQKKNV